jgi:uncharacterized protein YndB with AHSA1/START domain
MPVKRDENGRRYVQAEVEVEGSPEEVWKAIATGPGVSAWFVPTQVEERVGGTVTANFGPGMDSLATVTEWDPPHRFVADSRDDMGDDGPTIATEWIVEAKSGGVCVVRVVHSWFTEKDDWDSQFEGHTLGWIGFFRILSAYLKYFAGQSSAAFQVMGFAPEPATEAWSNLTKALGLPVTSLVGQQVQSSEGAPVLAGTVEHAGPAEWPELLIRLDTPTTGIAHLFAMAMGGQVCLSVRFYLYGDQAEATVAREEPIWQAWIAEHFPMPIADSETGA